MQKLLVYFTSVIFCCIPGTLFSQSDLTQTIRGVVLDMHSQISLPGATVIISNSNPIQGSVSDSEGEFLIEKVSVGRIDLQISYIGYNTVNLRNIELKSGKELVLTIELEEQVTELESIDVKAYSGKDKALNEMAVISARSFTVEETERYAGSWFDPARMAANYAGVMAAGDQRNDIIIRGNSPSGLLWRLDGVDIPNPNHFGTLGTTGGPISILNNNMLDNSDFFTGAFPAEYGNATSGVFDLNLRNGNNHKREYTAQVGMNGFELGAEGPFSKKSKASYIASYRYSTLSIFDAMGINFGVSGVPQYQDATFKINIPNTKAGKFTLFGVGGMSYIEVLNKNKKDADWTFGKSNLDFRFGSGMGVIGLSNLYFFNNTTRILNVVAVSGVHSSARVDSAFADKPSFIFFGDNSSEIKYSYTSKLTKKINAKNNFSAGLTFDVFDVNYEDSVMRKANHEYLRLTETSGEKLLLFQSFTQIQHKFTDYLKFYGGLHFQYFPFNGSWALEPRTSLSWTFKPKHSFSIGAGVQSQLQPRLFYFFQTPTPAGLERTNTELDFSKSNQAVIAYDYLITKNLRLKLESYYQHLYNIPVEQKSSTFSMVNYGNDFFPEREDSLVNKGTGKNYGLELTFEKFLSNYYYFLITTSIFDSKYTGSDKIERNTIYNGNYVFNVLGGYTFKLGKYNTLSLDLKTVNAGGKHYIPVDLEASKLTGTLIEDTSKAYEPKYDDYFRLDSRLTLKINRKKFNTEIAFDVQNLTRKKNVLLQTYNVQTQSVQYDYQLGLFYMFLIRFQF